MSLEKLVWEKLRLLRLIPGAHFLFYQISKLIYKDSSVIKIRSGPAANSLWRHYRIYQPWMASGIYEPEVAELIHNSLHPGDIFYDIGAHAGYFSLIAAKKVAPDGRVFAFDPVPEHVATILEQIELNGIQNICSVVPLAISDTIGEVSFLIPNCCANAHLLKIAAPHIINGPGKVIRVSSVTLDSFVSDNPMPTLIKMDIEGAEVEALMGAEKLLSSPKAPVFLITAHSKRLETKVRDILSSNFYKFTNFPHMIHAIPIRGKR